MVDNRASSPDFLVHTWHCTRPMVPSWSKKDTPGPRTSPPAPPHPNIPQCLETRGHKFYFFFSRHHHTWNCTSTTPTSRPNLCKRPLCNLLSLQRLQHSLRWSTEPLLALRISCSSPLTPVHKRQSTATRATKESTQGKCPSCKPSLQLHHRHTHRQHCTYATVFQRPPRTTCCTRPTLPTLTTVRRSRCCTSRTPRWVRSTGRCTPPPRPPHNAAPDSSLRLHRSRCTRSSLTTRRSQDSRWCCTPRSPRSPRRTRTLRLWSP